MVIIKDEIKLLFIVTGVLRFSGARRAANENIAAVISSSAPIVSALGVFHQSING